ncbi:MAG: hypothetical protein RLZ98_1907 [Pseudomonadota bacterium]|jgi:hypothetical protein
MTNDDAKRQRSDIEEIRLLLKQLEEAAAREIHAEPAAPALHPAIQDPKPNFVAIKPLENVEFPPRSEIALDPKRQLATLGGAHAMLERRHFDPPMPIPAVAAPRAAPRRSILFAAAGTTIVCLAGGAYYASVVDVPGVSPHVAPVVDKARTTVTALLQGFGTERTGPAGATPDPRHESATEPALDKPAAATTAQDDPPSRPAPAETAATTAAGRPEAALDIALAGALAPIRLPTEPPPIETRKAPAEITLAAAAIRPLVMPTEAPVVNVSLAPPTTPAPQAAEMPPPPPANVSTNRIEPPLPEKIEPAAPAGQPDSSAASGDDLMPPDADSPAVVASGEVEFDNPQAVQFQSARDVSLQTGADANLGLTTPSQPADSGLLLVARGIPPGIRLSKGSRIGRDSWFMPAADLEAVRLRADTPIAGNFTLTFEIVTVDGRVVSTATTKVQSKP